MQNGCTHRSYFRGCYNMGDMCGTTPVSYTHLIYTERNGIYIIDLQKSVGKVDEAYNAVADIVAEGGTILFVGTKKQAQDAIQAEAERCGMYYVNERWLGGMLTNFKTIQSRIARLKAIEKMSEDGTFDVLPKKEVINLKKEWDKPVSYTHLLVVM